MNMCQAFSKVYPQVILYGIDGQISKEKDLFDIYGVQRSFEIRLIKSRSGLLYALQVFLSVVFHLKATIYTRNLYLAGILGLFNRKVVYESHYAHWTTSYLHRFLFTLFALRKKNKLVVISHALKNLYMTHTRFQGSILVAHDGANPLLLSTTEQSKSRLVVGYIGSLYHGRGVEQILEAARKIPEFDFLFVGGPREQKERLEQTYQLKNVSFIGHVQPSEVKKYLEQSDILVAPYQKSVRVFGNTLDTAEYMSPLKIFEYMSSQRPIIVSDLPVLHEVLDQECARFVQADDVENWVTSIRSLGDPAIRKLLSTNAYKRFLAKYTWEERAKLIAGFI